MKTLSLLVCFIDFFVWKSLAQSTFTNLDFEFPTSSITFRSGSQYPVADAFPGWSATVSSVTYDQFYIRGPNLYLEPGIFQDWAGRKGSYFAALQPGSFSTVSLSQTGYLDPAIKSVRFTVYPVVADTTPVSFAGHPLPLVVLNSNWGYTQCAADISQFAGTTGELSFTASTFLPVLYLDGIFFSTEPAQPAPAFPPSIFKIFRDTVQGSITIQFSCQPGYSYVVLKSRDLSTWSSAGSVKATSSIVQFDDWTPLEGARFYKVQHQ